MERPSFVSQPKYRLGTNPVAHQIIGSNPDPGIRRHRAADFQSDNSGGNTILFTGFDQTSSRIVSSKGGIEWADGYDSTSKN